MLGRRAVDPRMVTAQELLVIVATEGPIALSYLAQELLCLLASHFRRPG